MSCESVAQCGVLLEVSIAATCLLLSPRNNREFRQRSDQFKSDAEVQRAVLFTASNVDVVSKIREIVIVNLEERASIA